VRLPWRPSAARATDTTDAAARLRPGDEILWEIDEYAWLFLEPNVGHAGGGRITLSVVGLDGLLERLSTHGIQHEPIEIYADGVRHVNVPDPDGKRLRSRSRLPHRTRLGAIGPNNRARRTAR
jgi:hypothetical protein